MPSTAEPLCGVAGRIFADIVSSKWSALHHPATMRAPGLVFRGTDVSVYRDTTGGSTPGVAILRRLPGQPRAPIAILSAAKRQALLTCLNSSGLRKKAGAWHGAEKAKPISGVTVADLVRDGMLVLTTEHRASSAQLTERGIWFAQTLLDDGTPQGQID